MAWEILYIYGTFKTAMSVTYKLRSEGKKVRAREQGNGNCVVEIWKEKIYDSNYNSSNINNL